MFYQNDLPNMSAKMNPKIQYFEIWKVKSLHKYALGTHVPWLYNSCQNIYGAHFGLFWKLDNKTEHCVPAKQFIAANCLLNQQNICYVSLDDKSIYWGNYKQTAEKGRSFHRKYKKFYLILNLMKDKER